MLQAVMSLCRLIQQIVKYFLLNFMGELNEQFNLVNPLFEKPRRDRIE
jgi:hypothetical protein